jgi:hypothetical protein
MDYTRTTTWHCTAYHLPWHQRQGHKHGNVKLRGSTSDLKQARPGEGRSWCHFSPNNSQIFQD